MFYIGIISDYFNGFGVFKKFVRCLIWIDIFFLVYDYDFEVEW